MSQPKFQFLLCLLVYTIAVRWMPYLIPMNPDIDENPMALWYPWNFSPLTAVCIFGGAFLADRRLSFLLPLTALLISDIGIALISGHIEWGFQPRLWLLTYVSFSIAAAMGLLLRRLKSTNIRGAAVGMGLLFEVAFFIVSNYLVWYVDRTSATPLYQPTTEGLMHCYQVALPFFGRSLLGTTAFTLLLFSPLGIRAAMEPTDDVINGELAPVRVK